MMLPVNTTKTRPCARAASPRDRDHHLVETLIERLPGRMRAPTRWLRRPSSRWVRIPTGVLLVLGGLLSILPLLGLWMLPLGLFLLAEDMPPLRRTRNRILDRIHRDRPHWFVSEPEAGSSHSLSPPSSAIPSNTRS